MHDTRTVPEGVGERSIDPEDRELEAGSSVGLESRFPNLSQDALYMRIATHVRDLIETRQLRPGERLPAERDLAEMLGVSRLPIREAMRTLAAQGLIEIRRGRGMFVRPQSIDATIDHLATVLLNQHYVYEDLFAVRRLLEPAAAGWAAAGSERDDVQRLQLLLGAMEDVANSDPPDFDTLAQHDSQLHIEIANCSGNSVLVRIMRAIQGTHRDQLQTSLRYRDRVHQTVRDHQRIVSAILAGDPVEAGNAMTDHLDNGETATLSSIEGIADKTRSE